MCRHFAFLGPATSLATLISAPEYGLLRQSWSPRRQRNGTMNADGFGVGWYAEDDPTPARYRRAVPIWTDQSFADVARVTRSGAVLAAVRSATSGTTPDEAAAAPYTSGQWLFSHNGRIDNWPRDVEDLAASLSPARLLALDARVDSALLWALVLQQLESSASPAEALTHVVTVAAASSAGRYNFLLTDGTSIAATAAGDTLFWRSDIRGTVVASEPFDDDAGWHEVPDQSVLIATTHGVDICPITPATLEASRR